MMPLSLCSQERISAVCINFVEFLQNLIVKGMINDRCQALFHDWQGLNYETTEGDDQEGVYKW
jgi:hypothetical protein